MEEFKTLETDNSSVDKKFTARAAGNIDLVVIASSTGGPIALETIFSQLPTDTNVPILIVQHMPPEFTNILAQTLSKRYNQDVKEGGDGDSVKAGTTLVAPGGMHMIVSSVKGFGNEICLLDTPYVNGVRPSADVLFHSVAKEYKGKNILAVVLTGMGKDGMQGVREMKAECNCYCITQSENTCVVYGMPKCVCEAGLSDEVGELNEIAFRMYQIIQGRR